MLAAVASPVYWVMMSMAALKAVIQLAVQPSYWEKTTHGLDAADHRPAPDREDHPIGIGAEG